LSGTTGHRGLVDHVHKLSRERSRRATIQPDVDELTLRHDMAETLADTDTGTLREVGHHAFLSPGPHSRFPIH
jgi:hypothetical protein